MAAAVAVALVRAPGPHAAQASSHREAPLISQDPRADNTDLYAFVSPDQPEHGHDDRELHPARGSRPAGRTSTASATTSATRSTSTTTGDGEEDVTYQFRFNTQTRNPNTFLYNTGPIDSLERPGLEPCRRPTASRAIGRRTGGADGARRRTSRRRRSTSARARRRTTTRSRRPRSHDLPGGVKVFAGQRDDPFFVDLGSIFDLAGLRPFNTAASHPAAGRAGVDGVAGYNTHTIAIQVPIAELRDQSCRRRRRVIGVYASASRQKIRDPAARTATTRTARAGSQVSRLGNPLDQRGRDPARPEGPLERDRAGRRRAVRALLLDARMTRLENVLYDALDDAPDDGPRTDLVAILLTGVPALNFTGADAGRPAPAEHRDRRRRRPGGAERPARRARRRPRGLPERAAARGRHRRHRPAAFAEARTARPQIIEPLRVLPERRTPNNLLGDGVDANDVPFRRHVPVRGVAAQGYEAVPPHAHERSVEDASVKGPGCGGGPLRSCRRRSG